MDREYRNLERRAAAGDPIAEDLLERYDIRIHGTHEWRAWVQELDRIFERIPTDIDAVFDYWRTLTIRSRHGPRKYASGPFRSDFRKLYLQVIKANWFENWFEKELRSLYSEVDDWLNERAAGWGDGIHGWDFYLKPDPHPRHPNTLIFSLHVSVQQSSEEAAEDQCLEIDDLLIAFDSLLTPHGHDESTWDSESTYETNKGNEDEDEDEDLEVYASFYSRCQIDIYHIVAVIDAQKNSATKDIARQYKELFED